MRSSRLWIALAVIGGVAAGATAVRLSPDADRRAETADFEEITPLVASPTAPGAFPAVGLQGGMPGGVSGMRGGMPPGIADMTPEQRMAMVTAMSAQGGASAMAVGSDGTLYVLRGATLYKYSPDLKLLATATLPPPVPAAPAQPARGR